MKDSIVWAIASFFTGVLIMGLVGLHNIDTCRNMMYSELTSGIKYIDCNMIKCVTFSECHTEGVILVLMSLLLMFLGLIALGIMQYHKP